MVEGILWLDLAAYVWLGAEMGAILAAPFVIPTGIGLTIWGLVECFEHMFEDQPTSSVRPIWWPPPQTVNVCYSDRPCQTPSYQTYPKTPPRSLLMATDGHTPRIKDGSNVVEYGYFPKPKHRLKPWHSALLMLDKSKLKDNDMLRLRGAHMRMIDKDHVSFKGQGFEVPGNTTMHSMNTTTGFIRGNCSFFVPGLDTPVEGRFLTINETIAYPHTKEGFAKLIAIAETNQTALEELLANLPAALKKNSGVVDKIERRTNVMD